MGVIEMPKSYRRNADEMLDTVCQKAAAKNQMLNTVCKIKCQRNVSMVYQVYQHTEKVMNYKKTKEKSESVTVP